MKEIVAKWRTHQELQTFTTLITLLKWKKKWSGIHQCVLRGPGSWGEKWSERSDRMSKLNTPCRRHVSTFSIGSPWHGAHSKMASADPFPPTSLSICDTKIQHSPSWKTLARRVQKNMYTYATRERRALPWVTKNTNKSNYLQPRMQLAKCGAC